ncbi:hypothetical protein HDK64DRAFT_256342 [Phyllosticta capitalensis]
MSYTGDSWSTPPPPLDPYAQETLETLETTPLLDLSTKEDGVVTPLLPLTPTPFSSSQHDHAPTNGTMTIPSTTNWSPNDIFWALRSSTLFTTTQMAVETMVLTSDAPPHSQTTVTTHRWRTLTYYTTDKPVQRMGTSQSSESSTTGLLTSSIDTIFSTATSSSTASPSATAAAAASKRGGLDRNQKIVLGICIPVAVIVIAWGVVVVCRLCRRRSSSSGGSAPSRSTIQGQIHQDDNGPAQPGIPLVDLPVEPREGEVPRDPPPRYSESELDDGRPRDSVVRSTWPDFTPDRSTVQLDDPSLRLGSSGAFDYPRFPGDLARSLAARRSSSVYSQSTDGVRYSRNFPPVCLYCVPGTQERCSHLIPVDETVRTSVSARDGDRGRSPTRRMATSTGRLPPSTAVTNPSQQTSSPPLGSNNRSRSRTTSSDRLSDATTIRVSPLLRTTEISITRDPAPGLSTTPAATQIESRADSAVRKRPSERLPTPRPGNKRLRGGGNWSDDRNAPVTEGDAYEFLQMAKSQWDKMANGVLQSCNKCSTLRGVEIWHPADFPCTVAMDRPTNHAKRHSYESDRNSISSGNTLVGKDAEASSKTGLESQASSSRESLSKASTLALSDVGRDDIYNKHSHAAAAQQQKTRAATPANQRFKALFGPGCQWCDDPKEEDCGDLGCQSYAMKLLSHS